MREMAGQTLRNAFQKLLASLTLFNERRVRDSCLDQATPLDIVAWKAQAYSCCEVCSWGMQTTLHRPAPLTVTGVFAALRQMAVEKGQGSAGRRQRSVLALLRSCRSVVTPCAILPSKPLYRLGWYCPVLRVFRATFRLHLLVPGPQVSNVPISLALMLSLLVLALDAGLQQRSAGAVT